MQVQVQVGVGVKVNVRVRVRVAKRFAATTSRLARWKVLQVKEANSHHLGQKLASLYWTSSFQSVLLRVLLRNVEEKMGKGF